MNTFSMLMFNMAQRFISLLGSNPDVTSGASPSPQPSRGGNNDEYSDLSQVEKIVKPIDELFDVIIVPLLILIGAAGTIYSIVLGVQYSKAESSDKREEAKKRLVNTIIGFVVVFVLLVVLRIFTNNITAIKDWITNTIAQANDPNNKA